MDKLGSMSVFICAAERGGFTAAGKVLGVNVSSVTKHIARLENELGARLVNRTTRSFALTEYGEKYYRLCKTILRDLRNGEADLRDVSRAPRGRVRVLLPISFARVTVIPALKDFREKFPELSLELVLKDEALNFIEEGFDLAVQTAVMADSRVTVRTLNRGEHVTVASKDYLKRHGTPRHPNDLAKHDCIIGQIGSEWKYRERDGSDIRIKVPTKLRIRGGDAYREAAAAGLGVAHATWWLFRSDIRNGNVVPILSEFATGSTPINVIFPAGSKQPLKVRAFINFLVQITKTRRAADKKL